MDRTLKDIEYDLGTTKKELKHLQEKEKTIQDRIDKYENELCKFK